jgi:hypothetical protein
VVALSGFVVGCAIGILQRRGRAQAQAISLLLAVAVGLQSVIGQTISFTTIVFTTNFTKLVGAIADSIAARSMSAGHMQILNS